MQHPVSYSRTVITFLLISHCLYLFIYAIDEGVEEPIVCIYDRIHHIKLAPFPGYVIKAWKLDDDLQIPIVVYINVFHHPIVAEILDHEGYGSIYDLEPFYLYVSSSYIDIAKEPNKQIAQVFPIIIDSKYFLDIYAESKIKITDKEFVWKVCSRPPDLWSCDFSLIFAIILILFPPLSCSLTHTHTLLSLSLTFEYRSSKR